MNDLKHVVIEMNTAQPMLCNNDDKKISAVDNEKTQLTDSMPIEEKVPCDIIYTNSAGDLADEMQTCNMRSTHPRINRN